MESTEEEKRIFLQFLKHYCESDACSSENDSLPFRHELSFLTEQEIEAESLDLCLQYLGMKECPPRLLIHLARAVTVSIVGQDHQQLLWEPSPPPCNREESNSSDDTVLIGDEEEDEKNKVPLIEKEKLAKLVKREIDRHCRQWRENLPSLAHLDSTPPLSVHAVRNTRRKMEDRHVVLPHFHHLLPKPIEGNFHYYAVFDGHGGVEAAVYAAAHLHCHLVNNVNFPQDISAALREAFIATDDNFVQKAKRESLRSGSTGVCAVLTQKTLHIGWLGDSQAILVRAGTPVTLMKPHKPERPDEKKRIEELGGCVVWFGAWRVNGTLSVSRAIGDADYKPFVSGEPDIATVELTGQEDYLVLACDGLWDTVSHAELVNHVYKHLQTESRQSTAQSLVQLAREQGSTDNISVVVVFLRENVSTPNVEEEDEDEDEQLEFFKENKEDKDKDEKGKDKDKDGSDGKGNGAGKGGGEEGGASGKETKDAEGDKDKDSSGGSKDGGKETERKQGDGGEESELEVSGKGKDATFVLSDEISLENKLAFQEQEEVGEIQGQSEESLFSQVGRESEGQSDESIESKGQSSNSQDQSNSQGQSGSSQGQSENQGQKSGSEIQGSSSKSHSDEAPSSDNTQDIKLNATWSSGDSIKSSMGVAPLSETTPPDVDSFKVKVSDSVDSNNGGSSTPKVKLEASNWGSKDSVKSAMGLQAECTKETAVDECLTSQPKSEQDTSAPSSQSSDTKESEESKKCGVGKEDKKSTGISEGEMLLLAHTATRCLHARRGRRGRNGHRRNHKENRRASKDKAASSGALALHTTGSNTSSRHSSIHTPPRRRESSKSSQRKYSGAELVHMITGAIPSKPCARDKWTVAIEIDVGAALFEETAALATQKH